MSARAGLTERETLERYEKRGGLLRGHFRLTSGLHSDIYLQSALVLQHPEDAGALGEGLAAPFRDDHVQTVLAPAIGGILVAHEVARALGVRALFTERENGMMRLRRGFTLRPGERCLVVEDVITTGGSTLKAIDAIEREGGKVAFCLVLVDREEGGRQAIEERGVHVISLFTRSSLLD
jgi:orotate phosphoribosyltransferase